MTSRPFLFLSGEHTVSMPAVFRNERWQHTMSGRRLVDNGDGTIRRDNVPGERLVGVVYFASVDDEAIRRHNLALLAALRFPCWPNPTRLLQLDDRHVVMRECIRTGLVDHDVRSVRHGGAIDLPRPFVLKTGNLHRGEGKHLVRDGDPLPQWDGEATAEPFFEGASARVLILGSDWYGIRYDNPNTWIKNAAGAELEMWPAIPKAAVEHAFRVHRHFGLDVSGIDYVIGSDGTPHFLEYNQFPGVAASDDTAERATRLFAEKMAAVEAEADTP